MNAPRLFAGNVLETRELSAKAEARRGPSAYGINPLFHNGDLSAGHCLGTAQYRYILPEASQVNLASGNCMHPYN